MDRVATIAPPLLAWLVLSPMAPAGIPPGSPASLAYVTSRINAFATAARVAVAAPTSMECTATASVASAAEPRVEPVAPARLPPAAQRPPYAERYDWTATWRSLDELRGLTPRSERFRAQWKELDELAGGRERDSRTLRDRPAIFRSRLLRAELAVLAGNKALTVPDPGAAIEFAPSEAWMAARHLVSGPLRVRAFREAIGAADGDLRSTRQARAVEVVDEDVRAGRLTTAEALARFLYDSSSSSEFTLALSRVLRASGRDQEAVPLLDTAFDRRAIDASERARLAIERGRVESNLGRETAAARWFGMALSEGSVDAAIHLGQNALDNGDYGGALTVFGALLDGDPVPVRAWRGWGLAQHLAIRPEPITASGNSATH